MTNENIERRYLSICTTNQQIDSSWKYLLSIYIIMNYVTLRNRIIRRDKLAWKMELRFWAPNFCCCKFSISLWQNCDSFVAIFRWFVTYFRKFVTSFRKFVTIFRRFVTYFPKFVTNFRPFCDNCWEAGRNWSKIEINSPWS